MCKGLKDTQKEISEIEVPPLLKSYGGPTTTDRRLDKLRCMVQRDRERQSLIIILGSVFL